MKFKPGDLIRTKAGLRLYLGSNVYTRGGDMLSLKGLRPGIVLDLSGFEVGGLGGNMDNPDPKVYIDREIVGNLYDIVSKLT